MATQDTSSSLPSPDDLPVIREHIAITPGICGGKPRIAGHRIRVQDIVAWHEQQGQTADEIVARFPQLSLGDVYAALTYYHDHRDEIRCQMEAERASIEEMLQQTPSKVRQKLRSQM